MNITLRGGTLGGAPITLRGGTLGDAPATPHDCKRVSESYWRAWFKGVVVGVKGGAGPFCVMVWMRSSAAAAVRSVGVTWGMVYMEEKRRHCHCCNRLWSLVCICGSGLEQGRHTSRVGRGWTSWFCVAIFLIDDDLDS